MLPTRPNKSDKKPLRYTSPTAKKIHTALFNCIRDEITEAAFENILQHALKSEPDAISRISSNGHTHLHDALHLPLELNIKESKQKAIRLAQIILNVLTKNSALLSSKDSRTLLVSDDNYGHHPLSQILMIGDRKLAQCYLQTLKTAYKANHISLGDIEHLLTRKSPTTGYTVFHQAAQADNHLILEDLIQFISSLYPKNDVRKEALIKFLSTPADSHLNPLPARPSLFSYAKETNDYLNQLRQGNINVKLSKEENNRSEEAPRDEWKTQSRRKKPANSSFFEEKISEQLNYVSPYSESPHTTKESIIEQQGQGGEEQDERPYVPLPKKPATRRMSKEDQDIDALLREIDKKSEKDSNYCSAFIATIYGLFCANPASSLPVNDPKMKKSKKL